MPVVYEITQCTCSQFVSLARIEPSKYAIGMYGSLSECLEKIRLDLRLHFDSTLDYIVKCNCYNNLHYYIKDIEKEALNEKN